MSDLRNIIFLDIETCPTPHREDFIGRRGEWPEDTPPPGNYRKPETIEKWRTAQREDWAAKGEDAWRKTALSAADGGEILVLCAATYDERGDRYDFVGAATGERQVQISEDAALPSVTAAHMPDETELLSSWWAWVGRRVMAGAEWCGFNSDHFDLPHLWQRSWIRRLSPPPLPRRNARWDAMLEWWGGSRRGHDARISLDTICFALGLPRKPGDIDGSRVWDVWQKPGGHERVLEYCRHDVESVRRIYERIAGLRPVPRGAR